MNLAVISGRIPFDITFFEGKEDKKAFASFTIAIATGNKTEEGYNEEELHRCNAWGYSAEHLNRYFQKGDRITFEGSLMRGKDWTDKEGVLREGQTELRVTRIDGFGTKNNNNEGGATETKQASKPATKPAAKPASKPATKPTAKAPAKPPVRRATAPAPKK